MFDWAGDLEKAGWISKRIIDFAEWLTNIANTIDSIFGWKAVAILLICLPLIVRLIIWIIHEWWEFRL